MYRGARREPLAKVLSSGHNYDADMPAGDFVRWARQVLDLLGQLTDASAASAGVRDTARKAIGAVNRGVLPYQAAVWGWERSRARRSRATAWWRRSSESAAALVR